QIQANTVPMVLKFPSQQLYTQTLFWKDIFVSLILGRQGHLTPAGITREKCGWRGPNGMKDTLLKNFQHLAERKATSHTHLGNLLFIQDQKMTGGLLIQKYENY